MHSPGSKRWIKFIFSRRGSTIDLFYEDGLGTKLDPGDSEVRLTYRDRASDKSIEKFDLYKIPAKVRESMLKVAASKPRQRSTPSGMQDIPVPIFCSADDLRYPAPYWLQYSEIFTEIIPESVQPGFQLCYLNAFRPVNNFELPLNIRFFGGAGEMVEKGLRSKSWFQGNANVESRGLTLKSISPESIPTETDVLIIDSSIDEGIINGSELNVKLLIFAGPIPWFPYKWSRRDYPILLVNNGPHPPAEFIVEFLYGIIHDFALHEALYWANTKFPGQRAQLIANEFSNHGLHLSDALEKYREEIKSFSTVINPGDKDNFMGKFPNLSKSSLSKLGKSLAGDTITNFLNNANNLGFYFHGERTGLVPMSDELQRFAEIKGSLEQQKNDLLDALKDTDIYNAILEKQERRVEVTIDKLNQALVYIPVATMEPLVAGNDYRLYVEIGQRSNYSLMSGEVEPIDAVLPDPENEKGHDLKVVVFEKDFTLDSPRVQTLHLPRFGATKRVAFAITTPIALAHAELRIMIFHGNNLLQSFLMEAEIFAQEVDIYSRKIEKPAIKVTMDVSTSGRFANLDDQKPRDLYLGINDGPAGTHQVFIKGEQGEGQIDMLTDTNIDNAQTDFGSILLAAYFNGKIPRFNDDNQPGAPKTEEYFEEIRRLANFGNSFYQTLDESAKDRLRDILDYIRASENKSIQVANLKGNYFFPWPTVYDYQVPPPNGRKYPVCSGKPFAPSAYPEFAGIGAGCPHNPDTHCYCELGFWGIRHKVEQLLPAPVARNSTSGSMKGNSSIMYSYNVDDAWTRKTLSSMVARKARIIADKDNLVELLWDDNARPSSLVVFGHMQVKGVPPDLTVPRILTFTETPQTTRPVPPDKFIYNQLIYNHWSKKKEWKTSPLPIIFLVNCDSNEFDIGSLNTIIGSFWRAGAAAIISTNCNIATGLGRRFIDEMITLLYDKNMELGDAIQAFNKKMFDSGLPLPFVFTTFGNINLTIK